MNSRVFVTQQPRPNGKGWTPNLSPAADFGTLRFVFEGAEKPYADPQWALETAEFVLLDFDAEKDYVLWPNTGDPAAAWAVMLALAKKGVSKIQTLYWERELKQGHRSSSEGFYSVVTFRLEANGNRKILSKEEREEAWPRK